MTMRSFSWRPFNVDVTHFLPADADIVQDDITGVPDDATQEEPEKEIIVHVWKCIFLR